MNCRRAARLLSNYLEDRLAPRAAAAVRAHLGACPACRRLRDDFRAAGADLRALPAPIPPPDAERRAVAQWLTEEQGCSARGWRGVLVLPMMPVRWGMSGLAVTAVAGLLVVIGIALARWERGPVIRLQKRTITARSQADGPGSAPRSAPHGSRTQGGTRLALAHSPPSMRPRWRPPVLADLGARDRGPAGAIRRRTAPPRAEMPTPSVADRIEAGVVRHVRVLDDFVRVSFPRLVSTSDESIAGAVESYRREAAVVDGRLTREITLQEKATALADLCERLRSDTSIQLAAGPSVADEKVTIFCEKQPLRDVMRQLSRPFGYTWLRSGKAGEYRYELVQDLRSQLLEEELRNRDRNAALLVLDRAVERYRKYLDLSPDEALARAKAAPPEEKKLLEQLATTGWGGAQMYFRLSPNDMAALRAGRSLIYGSNVPPDPLGRPYFDGKRTADGLDFVLRPLPPAIARGTLQGLRDWRVRDGRPLFGRAGERPEGLLPASSPDARAAVILKLSQNELGEYTLIASSGLALSPESTHYVLVAQPFAAGISPAVAHPDNRAANAGLAHNPALQMRVTVQPQASCAADPVPPGTEERGKAADPARVATADAMEALYRTTGMNIVADHYTRFFPAPEVSVRDTRLFDALNQLADATRTRWSKESRWLRFRSAGFYNDRLREVPNRLLKRWAASRRQHRVLTLDDLIEIAQLSDAQLGSWEMGDGVRRCFGLEEWFVASHPRMRYHLRFLGGFSSAQRQEALGAAGLPFVRMSLAQQQGFLDLAVDKDDPEKLRLGDLSGAALRVAYTLPGEFQWMRPQTRDLPPGESPSPSPVRERTREAALAAAQRIDPRADASQIVPTDLNLVFVYTLSETRRRQVAFQ